VGGNLDGSIGPKSCHNLLPVLVELQGDIAAGAFELLGQADVILSASDVLLTVPADPTSRLDVQHLRPRLPEPELRRLALLGAAEPMTAERAAQLGLIDVVVPKRELRDRATRALMQLAVNSRRGS
jgi:enoyl-CoA hydratase/carnithine racemase